MYYFHFKNCYNPKQFILENLKGCMKLAEKSGAVNVCEKLNDISKKYSSYG
jgi:hypothetical protein